MVYFFLVGWYYVVIVLIILILFVEIEELFYGVLLYNLLFVFGLIWINW